MSDRPPLSAPPPRRILVRGVNWLGDAVMTTPALQRLRERFPEAHITLLTPEKLKDLWLHHPSIDEIASFRPEVSARSIGARLRSSPAFAAPFDLALILPNSPRSALEMWLARIHQRLGYASLWRNWFLTRAIPTRPGHARMRKRSVHEIKRLIQPGAPDARHASRITQLASSHQIHDHLHLVAALGANPEPPPPRLEVTPDELKQAEESLLPRLDERLKHRAPGEPPLLLGLNPGAEYGPAKRWPAENFAAVAREVSRRIGNCVWLAFGLSNESKLCDHIVRLAGGTVINLAGKTSLRELMALLKLCR